MLGRVVLQIILFSETETGINTDAEKNNGAQSKTDVLSDAAKKREEKPLLNPQKEQQRETNVSNKNNIIFILC